jgi:hypothetical protein
MCRYGSDRRFYQYLPTYSPSSTLEHRTKRLPVVDLQYRGLPGLACKPWGHDDLLVHTRVFPCIHDSRSINTRIRESINPSTGILIITSSRARSTNWVLGTFANLPYIASFPFQLPFISQEYCRIRFCDRMTYSRRQSPKASLHLIRPYRKWIIGMLLLRTILVYRCCNRMPPRRQCNSNQDA